MNSHVWQFLSLVKVVFLSKLHVSYQSNQNSLWNKTWNSQYLWCARALHARTKTGLRLVDIYTVASRPEENRPVAGGHVYGRKNQCACTYDKNNSKSAEKVIKNNKKRMPIFYRDDGLEAHRRMSGPALERLKKEIIHFFKSLKLDITIETNLRHVDFLDVTFNLTEETFEPYHEHHHAICKRSPTIRI